MAGSLMHCMDLTTQRTTQRHMMMLHVLEREKLMFLQMFWVVQQEQSLLHLLSVLKMNSSMKLGVWATVQLRIAIGRPRHAVAQLRHVVVGCWVHQEMRCIPLSILLFVQLGLPPMEQSVEHIMHQSTDLLVQRLQSKYRSAADRLRIRYRMMGCDSVNQCGTCSPDDTAARLRPPQQAQSASGFDDEEVAGLGVGDDSVHGVNGSWMVRHESPEWSWFI